MDSSHVTANAEKRAVLNVPSGGVGTFADNVMYVPQGPFTAFRRLDATAAYLAAEFIPPSDGVSPGVI